MATHGKGELRDAARALAQAVRGAGMRPEDLQPPVTAPPARAPEADPEPAAHWDDERRVRSTRTSGPPSPRGVFDGEAGDGFERAA